MNNPGQSLAHSLWFFVLEHVSTKGEAGSARFDGVFREFENFQIGFHPRAASHYHWNRTTADNFSEAFLVTGVYCLNNVCSEFCSNPSSVGNNFEFIFALYVRPPRVHHCKERYPERITLFR